MKGKQTRARTISLNTYEAICVKRACEDMITRLEAATNQGAGILPDTEVIDILEDVIDKLDALPYFTTPARKPKNRAESVEAQA